MLFLTDRPESRAARKVPARARQHAPLLRAFKLAPLFVQLQACAATEDAKTEDVGLPLFEHVPTDGGLKGRRLTRTHGEVLAVELELPPHVDELVEVGAVEQQVNGRVPLLAGHQDVAQQLHVAEAFHHYGQGLRRQACERSTTVSQEYGTFSPDHVSAVEENKERQEKAHTIFASLMKLLTTSLMPAGLMSDGK